MSVTGRSGVWRGERPLLLASASPARRRLLAGAGLPVDVEPAGLDERALERGWGPLLSGSLAARLAAAKADAVATRHPDRIVVGADQVLEFDGRALGKPADRHEARRQLAELAGHTHVLHSAVAIRGPDIADDNVATATLTMRALEADALDLYSEVVGDGVLVCAGGYAIEGLGIHLFTVVDGEHSTILGLPLLPFLAALRRVHLIGI